MSRALLLAALVASSPAFAQSVAPPRVVAPEKLAGYWAMVNESVEADVPNIARNISAPGCAAVSFVVEKDGRTSSIKVQRVVPAGDFSLVAQSMAKNMRFEPTVSNSGRDRVFSWLIFPFNMPADAAARTAAMQPCAIARLDWNDH